MGHHKMACFASISRGDTSGNCAPKSLVLIHRCLRIAMTAEMASPPFLMVCCLEMWLLTMFLSFLDYRYQILLENLPVVAEEVLIFY